MLTWDDVVAMAMQLTDSTSATCYGRPAVKVRGQLLTCTGKEPDHFVLMLDPEERQVLLENYPNMFFVTPHYQDSRGMQVRYETADDELIEVLLERSWQQLTADE
jgi:hypothetical protein